MNEWQTKYTEYWSYHGPNAGEKTIKRLATEIGIDLPEKQIHRILMESQYQQVEWIMAELEKMGAPRTSTTRERGCCIADCMSGHSNAIA